MSIPAAFAPVEIRNNTQKLRKTFMQNMIFPLV